MSYPPPPGLSSAKPPSAGLPARPPASASSFKPVPNNGASKPAFAAFAPRAVASTSTARTSSPIQYPGQPGAYGSAPAYNQSPTSAYPGQSYDQSSYYQAPQIRNPFVPTAGAASASSSTAYGAPQDFDAEYQAQIQQWQSAYISKDDSHKPGTAPRPAPAAAPTPAPTVSGPASRTDTANQQDTAQKTVQRHGGGKDWTDSSLLEWDPAHFRIFVGNLAGEVTDDSLLKAFAKFSSVQKARVIREKRTTKSKGYGFVSFADGDDYFQAAREMQGKYIGSHPVLIKRAMTEVKPTTIKDDKRGKHKNRNKGNSGNSGGGVSGKVEHGGIQKKAPKTKGGLKVLG